MKGWIVTSPQKKDTYWSPNPLYLSLGIYLEIRLLQMLLVMLRWGHPEVGEPIQYDWCPYMNMVVWRQRHSENALWQRWRRAGQRSWKLRTTTDRQQTTKGQEGARKASLEFRGPQPGCHLEFRLPVSRIGRPPLLWFQPPSSWCPVTAALGNEYSTHVWFQVWITLSLSSKRSWCFILFKMV